MNSLHCLHSWLLTLALLAADSGNVTAQSPPAAINHPDAPVNDDVIAKLKGLQANQAVLLGTNDLNAQPAPDAFARNLDAIITRLLANKTIPVLTTVPPRRGKDALVGQFNEAVWRLGAQHKVPVIDYHGEIVSRRPTDWDGTLVSQDGVHPSAGESAGPATEANLSRVTVQRCDQRPSSLKP